MFKKNITSKVYQYIIVFRSREKSLHLCVTLQTLLMFVMLQYSRRVDSEENTLYC